MTGEYEDRNFIVTRGDVRVAMTIAKNTYTSKFNRQSRFLIDDIDAKVKLSFDLSKALRTGHIYNGKGVYQFVLSESNSTDFDNMELAVPNYYKYFDEDGDVLDNDTEETPDSTEESSTEETSEEERRIWF